MHFRSRDISEWWSWPMHRLPSRCPQPFAQTVLVEVDQIWLPGVEVMELRQGIQAEAQAHPLLVARAIGVYRPVGVEEMPFDPGVTLEDQLAKLSEVREPVLERGVLE